jgi:hypothetical protein
MDAWVDHELGGGFPDRRLKARLAKILGDLGRRVGGTVPAAWQDRAATKAAYRFFSNLRVDEGVIPAGHFEATKARFAATTGSTPVQGRVHPPSARGDRGRLSDIARQHHHP